MLLNFLVNHGLSATTLPSRQMYIGVPCMRATLRATRAERRRARNPAAANSAASLFLLFMGLARSVEDSFRNYRKEPTSLQVLDNAGSSFSNHVRSDEELIDEE